MRPVPVVTEPRDVHARDQREAEAESTAGVVSAFYRRLRATRVPAGAAQALAEAFVAGLMARDDAQREPWD